MIARNPPSPRRGEGWGEGRTWRRALLSLAIVALSPASVRSAPKKPVPPSAPEAGVATDERRRALLLTDLLLEEERVDEAEALVKQAFEVDSSTGEWTLRLARIRTTQQRFEEAADLYERLLGSQADDAGLLLQVGQLAYAAGDPDRAERFFLRSRELLKEPIAPYYLSELAFSRERTEEGRRWAAEALKELEGAQEVGQRRLRLNLQARLGWRDELHEEFGRLYDRHPRDAETLGSWASCLIRAGLVEDAVEPLAMLRERFPKGDFRWRELEADRLRKIGDASALRAHLEDSVARYPKELGFVFALGELDARERRWEDAEPRLSTTAFTREYGKASRELLSDVLREGRTQAGPRLRWRESDSARTLETTLAGEGYPRRGWKLEGEAGRSEYRLKSRKRTFLLSGGEARLLREAGAWTLGADLDVRSGSGSSFVSPGGFARWKPLDALSVEAGASARRAWRDSGEAVAVGAWTHELTAAVVGRPWRRLYVGGQARANRATPRGGGTATQLVAAPEAIVTVLDRPLQVGLGYRFVSVDVSGDDLFFTQLPLLRRVRTQYAILSFGRYWREGRLRGDGYVYNGHEPERGRRFGTGSLVGFGANLDWLTMPFRWRASYEHTQEDSFGVGGRSRSATLQAAYLW